MHCGQKLILTCTRIAIIFIITLKDINSIKRIKQTEDDELVESSGCFNK